MTPAAMPIAPPRVPRKVHTPLVNIQSWMIADIASGYRHGVMGVAADPMASDAWRHGYALAQDGASDARGCRS